MRFMAVRYFKSTYILLNGRLAFTPATLPSAVLVFKDLENMHFLLLSRPLVKTLSRTGPRIVTRLSKKLLIIIQFLNQVH